MNAELKQILDKFLAEINNWNRKVVTNEEEFVSNLKKLSGELVEELKKPQADQKSIPV